MPEGTYYHPFLNRDRIVHIVDLDLQTCEELSVLFRLEGFQTAFSINLPGFMAGLERRRPDVVIVNFDLTEAGEGLALLRRVKTLRLGTPVFMLENRPQVEAAVAAMKAGAADVVTKPLDNDNLVRIVRDALRQDIHVSAVTAGRRSVEVRGFAQLTPREREVLQLITDGQSNKEAGGAWHLTAHHRGAPGPRDGKARRPEHSRPHAHRSYKLTLQPRATTDGGGPAAALVAPSAQEGTMVEFTTDWFGRYPEYWSELFESQGWRPEVPRTVIEVGSFEGRSALWILTNLLQHPDSHLFCVDTFPDRGGADSYWRRFESNVLRSAHGHKVSVSMSASLPFLAAFVAAGSRADFVYVDGSHRAADVLEDLVLAFHAIRPGGVIICDDYLWGVRKGDVVLGSPKLAVDAFTTIYRDRLDIPWGQPLYQLAMIKTGDRAADNPSARGG